PRSSRFCARWASTNRLRKRPFARSHNERGSGITRSRVALRRERAKSVEEHRTANLVAVHSDRARYLLGFGTRIVARGLRCPHDRRLEGAALQTPRAPACNTSTGTPC